MESTAGSRAVVLAFRLALLVLAACAAAVAVWIGTSGERSPRESIRYVCPMHPEVTATGPGPCPICGMDLERLKSSDSEAAAAIDPSTYLNYDVARFRGTGPDAPAPAWVDGDGALVAVVYRDELDGFARDARGWFYPSDAPDRAIRVRAVPGGAGPHDRSTSEVIFRLDADGTLPAATLLGRIRILDKGRELPVIPYAAVIEGADGPYVLVASPDGKALVKRSVQIGKIFGGLAFVLSGLGSRERVLTRGAFFVDAERRLHRQTAVEVNR